MRTCRKPGYGHNIRPALGERFATAVEATVDAIAEHPLQFPVVYRNRRRAGVRLLSLWDILRDSGASDCSNCLLPRQAQSETLAKAIAFQASEAYDKTLVFAAKQ